MPKTKTNEQLIKETMKWRRTPHVYEQSKPFKAVDGKMYRNLFCNMCGQSENWHIHEKQNQSNEK